MATNLVALIDYHVLFFGLDFYFARAILKNLWHKGLIDVLPILEGGIRYVLKYVDKQQFGDDLKKNFTDQDIEAPFSSVSTGIGANLFYDQIDYIQKTGKYKTLSGKERPISPYYKELFGARDVDLDFSKFTKYQKNFVNDPLFKRYDQYEAEMMYARERAYAISILNDGHAAYVPDKPMPRSYGALRQMMFKQYERSKIKQFEAFNQDVLTQLYELKGVCV